MTTHRYPSKLNKDSTYIMFTRYLNQGFTTEELKSVDKFEYTSQIKSAIALPVPNNLQDSIAIGYNDTQDMSITGQMAQGVLDKTGTSAIITAGSKYTGQTKATQQMAVFDNVALKSFTHSWKLIPETREEGLAIENIINSFEEGSLPHSVETLISTTPDIWKIKISGNSKLIKYLPCLVTGVVTNLTPDGHFQIYDDGMYPAIEFSVSFTELTSRTRDIVKRLR